jgi:hypothetical protein
VRAAHRASPAIARVDVGLPAEQHPDDVAVALARGAVQGGVAVEVNVVDVDAAAQQALDPQRVALAREEERGPTARGFSWLLPSLRDAPTKQPVAGGTGQLQVLPGGFLPHSRRRIHRIGATPGGAWADSSNWSSSRRGLGLRWNWSLGSAWISSRRGCCQAVEDAGRRAGEEESCRARAVVPSARRRAASADPRSRLPGEGERESWSQEAASRALGGTEAAAQSSVGARRR